MKYKVSYLLGEDPRKHVRYYNALDKSTALEMFNATCEESLGGEKPHHVYVKEIFVVKSKNT